jgi:hypothetical protein
VCTGVYVFGELSNEGKKIFKQDEDDVCTVVAACYAYAPVGCSTKLRWQMRRPICHNIIQHAIVTTSQRFGTLHLQRDIAVFVDINDVEPASLHDKHPTSNYNVEFAANMWPRKFLRFCFQISSFQMRNILLYNICYSQ